MNPAACLTLDELAHLRDDTPLCSADRVHLNNAGASPSPRPVLDRVVEHLQREARIGGYEAADEVHESLEAVYASVARLIGGSADEIALQDSATRAWDIAFFGVPLTAGDVVLTASAEYGSNAIAMLQRARQCGARIEVLPDDADGRTDVGAVADALERHRVALVAITHVPSHTGRTNPVAEIGALTRAAGVPYLVDACQSVGQLEIDVEAIGCDMLSATGRKFLRAPRGTGFLWVRRGLIERLHPPMLDLRSATWTAPGEYTVRDDARRFELWESSVACRLGLGEAVDYASNIGLGRIQARVTELAARLKSLLADCPGVEVQEPRGVTRSGIVTLACHTIDAPTLSSELREAGFNTSVATRSVSQTDLGRRGLDSVLRLSVHYFNEDAELERVVEAIAARTGARTGGAP